MVLSHFLCVFSTLQVATILVTMVSKILKLATWFVKKSPYKTKRIGCQMATKQTLSLGGLVLKFSRLVVKLGIIIGTEGKQRFREKMGAKNFHPLLNLLLGVKGWSLQTGEQNTEDLSYVEEVDDSQARSGSMKLFHAGGTTVESWFLKPLPVGFSKVLIILTKNALS